VHGGMYLLSKRKKQISGSFSVHFFMHNGISKKYFYGEHREVSKNKEVLKLLYLFL
jgi:hypothetical protein